MAFANILFAFLATVLLTAFAKDGIFLQDITCFTLEDLGDVINLNWNTIYEGIAAASQPDSPLVMATYSMSETTLNTFNYTDPNGAAGNLIFAAVVFINEPNCQLSEITFTPDRLAGAFMDLVDDDDCSITGGYGSNGCAGYMLQPNPTNVNMPLYWNFMVEMGW